MSQTYKKYFKIEYLLLFLVSLEFLGKTNYIILLFFIFLLCRYRYNSNVFVSSYLPWVILFSLFYFILGGNTISISTPFTWIASYSIGIMLCIKSKNPYTSLLTIISLGTALHGILVYLNTYQVAEIGARTSIDIWGGIRAGTSSACSFLLYSGILYSLICKNNKIIIRIILIGITVFVPLNAILISSRSALIYPCIIFLISYLFTLNKKNYLTKFFLIITISFVLIILYEQNIGGIKSYFENSFLYVRLEEKHDGGIAGNSRFSIWTDRFDTIIDNFWGGGLTLYGVNIYMHNIILDTIAYGGFPTAVILVVIMLHNIYNVVFLCKKTLSTVEKSCLIGISSAFYIIFMFEPIIQSSGWYFCLYLFFAGVIDMQKKIIKQSNITYSLNKQYYRTYE